LWDDYDLGDVDTDFVRFAWVGTQAFSGTSAFDMTTSSFTHELVEAMTDPEVSGGVRENPDPGGGGGEIGDVCGQIAKLEGVAVAAYWSNLDRACVIPNHGYQTFWKDPDARPVGPPVDGPEQDELVSEFCGFGGVWQGTYAYRVRQQQVDLPMQAISHGYTNPVGVWTVAGVALSPGANDLSVSAEVEFPKLLASTLSFRLVTLHCTAANDTLTIRNEPGDGNFGVDVVYTVNEQSDNLAQKSSLSRWSGTVQIIAQTVQSSDEFKRAQEACEDGRDRSNRGFLQDLGDLVYRLVNKGDPGPLDGRTKFQVRRLYEDLGRKIDELAPPTLRSQGLGESSQSKLSEDQR